MRGPPLIQFRDVDLAFGDHLVLGKLSLEIGAGEIVCIVGPSGCGKTTALRVAAGLIAPTRGEVAFAGAPVKGPRRDVAVVFQDYSKALLPWRTAAGNVSLALEAMGASRAERQKRIAALLKRVGLPNHANKYPAQLSGGIQQRLQIARCLAQEPAALMMDEPFGALDAMTRQTLQDEMLGGWLVASIFGVGLGRWSDPQGRRGNTSPRRSNFCAHCRLRP
jgi:NitT/TauT family transport system ATP-binding protein